MKSFGMNIRPYQDQDWPLVWKIIMPVFRAGETYAFSPDISEEEAHKVWIEKPEITYVAVGEDADILGTYYIKPNQPTLGAHVCNCGYIVAEQERGRGSPPRCVNIPNTRQRIEDTGRCSTTWLPRRTTSQSSYGKNTDLRSSERCQKLSGMPDWVMWTLT
jgi:hypothetical protein